MWTTQLLDTLPIYAVLLLTFLLLVAAYEAGYQWGCWLKAKRGESVRLPLGTLIGGLLALLGIILGFVFAMASERFDERKHLVLQEANAIGTTWLRARTLPTPYPEQIIPLLQEYLQVRIAAETGQNKSPGGLQKAIERSAEMHEQLWKETIELVRDHPESRVVSLFILSLNNMIDLHESRITVGLHFRLFPSVWRTLYLVVSLFIITMGYEAGRSGARHPLTVSLSLMLTLSLVLVLIIDLDRPAQRLFHVEHKSLLDLQNTMADVEADPGGKRN